MSEYGPWVVRCPSVHRFALIGMLAYASRVEAVTEDGIWGNDRLLAWSKTGECYSIDRATNADTGAFLQCGDARAEAIGHDANGNRWTEATVARDRGLLPVTAAHREAFAAQLSVTMRRACNETEGTRSCRWTWRLVRTSDGATIGSADREILSYPAAALRDRAAVLGGYLHPSGKLALVKFNFVESGNRDHTAFFELVKLSPG